MSFHSPLCESLDRRVVASENLDTEMPVGVNLVSASLPRFPSRMTLLTLREAILPSTVTHSRPRFESISRRLSEFGPAGASRGAASRHGGSRVVLREVGRHRRQRTLQVFSRRAARAPS